MSAKDVTDQEPREQAITIPDEVPAMALKDAVLFPFVMVPLSVGRDRSVAAVDQALAENRLLLLVSQKDPNLENPTSADLYTVGTVAGILRMIKLPDGRVRILVQGLARARIDFWSQEEPYLRAHITRLEEPSHAGRRPRGGGLRPHAARAPSRRSWSSARPSRPR